MPQSKLYDDAALYGDRPSGLIVLVSGMFVGLFSALVFFALALAAGLIQFSFPG